MTTFPTNTTLLDNFNRASLGGTWTTPTFGDQSLTINASTTLTGPASNWGAGYLNTASYGPGIEEYCDVPTSGGVTIGLMYDLNSGGTDAAPNGYETTFNEANNSFISRVDNGANTVLGAKFSDTVNNGDKVGIREDGSGNHDCFIYTSGAWGASIATRVDNTYTSGHLGFEINGYFVDNMSGGNIITTPPTSVIAADYSLFPKYAMRGVHV